MAGPYYDDQKPQKCKCFYPDVTIVQDKVVEVDGKKVNKRFFHCLIHGEVEEEVPMIVAAWPVKLPSEEKRESERNRLLSKKKN